MSTAEPAALLEDYKLKAAFTNSVVGRVLTEFQVMVTLETALATGLIFSANGTIRPAARWIVVLLFAISVAWAVAGGVARARSKASQAASDAAGKLWAAAVGIDPASTQAPSPAKSTGAEYLPVGTGQNNPLSAVAVPTGLALLWIIVWLVIR